MQFAKWVLKVIIVSCVHISVQKICFSIHGPKKEKYFSARAYNVHICYHRTNLDSCMVELNSNGMPANDIFQVVLNLCPGKGWTLEDIKTR